MAWLAGHDPDVQRLLNFWAIGVLLYLVNLALLLVEVAYGNAPVLPALGLTAQSIAGVAAFFVAIRAGTRRGWPAARLNAAQGLYAITCIVAAYALIGPARGLTVAVLIVVLVFGAFAANARQSHALSLYALGLLAPTMVAMTRLDPLRYAPRDELVNFAMAAGMMAAVAYLAGRLSRLRARLRTQRAELAQALERIGLQATRDGLTGLVNRGHMHELLTQGKARHDAQAAPLALALIDLDHFKRINDTCGHAAGDAVLRGFAEQARAAIRSQDTLARWGGEEFLLLLPATDQAQATMVVERLRERIALHRFDGLDTHRPVTCSAGLAVSGPGEPIEASIERADRALYRAKANGRNRVLAAQAPVTRRLAPAQAAPGSQPARPAATPHTSRT